MNFFFMFSLTFLAVSCGSLNGLNPFSQFYTAKLISEMNCQELKYFSQNTKESLKGLAGLKGLNRCQNFEYSIDSLTDFEKKLYSKIIQDLNNKNIAEPALDLLSIADLKIKLNQNTEPSEKFNLFKLIRIKQRTSNKKTDSYETTKQFHKWTIQNFKQNKKNKNLSLTSADYLSEATTLLARQYWTEHNDTEALKLLNSTEAILGNDFSKAEIHFLKARIFEEQGLLDDTIKQIDLGQNQIEKFKPKQTSLSNDRIKWMKSWILYKSKKWDLAEVSLSDLALTTLDHSEKSRALFYKSRTQKAQGKIEESKQTLKSLLDNDFYSFYSLVTYNELNQNIPPLSSLKKEIEFNPDLKLNFLSKFEKNIFLDLIKHKENDLAEYFIQRYSDQLEKSFTLSLVLAQKSKRYLPLFANFTKLTNSQKIDILNQYSELIFPTPYKKEVTMMADKTQLPISLIYSIMKQESAFNEKTRSHADAMGLMQVIPRLAEQLEKKFKIGYNNSEDLFDPKINIQLGSYELMEQVKNHSGQLTFVAAAYNAGPNALANWLKTRNKNDILDFIEEIPYEETRTYVKIIARNKIFYERVSKQDESIPFPIEFLTAPLQ